MNKSFLLSTAALCLISCTHKVGDESSTTPAWLEPDSAEAIHQRLLKDFPLTFEEGAQKIIAEHPDLTIDSIENFVANHYVEVMEIDGVRRMHRKSPGNVELLNPAYNGGWIHRGWNASPQRISYADSIVKWKKGLLPDGGAHEVAIRFSIDVPYNPALKGDTLRVWMPFPLESDRQNSVTLISSFPEVAIISTPEQSAHCSIYMQQPVNEDDTTHFEYTATFVTRGAYYAPAEILANMKPYDKDGEIYKKYTAFDSRHIVRLDSLAHAIVGEENNPFRQSELVYDYIITNYPWAGAREYSTLPCIPQYVLDEKHGDCGQVALLYISLMRTLGVPSRWESGWMLHPGEKNLHDWAETYYEGIGWVPVDVSFGRYATSDDPAIRNFYSSGIDAHRFAANKGVGEQFYPAKRYIRSETVDAQLGEVECSKGNLFYPGWDINMEILSSKPIVQ